MVYNKYNDDPVFYCKHCLSLKIGSLEGIDNSDFCEDCNSTDIKQTDIFTWELMYRIKYKKYYINHGTSRK